MLLDFKICETFQSRFKRLLSSYPNSNNSVIDNILGLSINQLGDRYPGFNDLIVMKTRIGLPEYGIGKRGGLRFIYLIIQDKKLIVPIYLYEKTQFKKEKLVKGNIKKLLPKL